MEPEGVKHVAEAIAQMPQLSTVKYMPPRLKPTPHRSSVKERSRQQPHGIGGREARRRGDRADGAALERQ
eukprot:1633084-Prymnesium_polylepis.1